MEIVAEHDARSLEFESEDDYIAELDAVKARAERRLKRGESILSVVLGVVILPPTIAGVQLFQMQVYWWSVATVVQYYLIVVAVVVLYRVAIFDILSFTGDEAFDTLSEWDAALSYQRGLALIDFMQFLTLVVVIGLAITRVRFELFEMVLERKYAENLSFREWTVYAWQSLRGGDYR